MVRCHSLQFYPYSLPVRFCLTFFFFFLWCCYSPCRALASLLLEFPTISVRGLSFSRCLMPLAFFYRSESTPWQPMQPWPASMSSTSWVFFIVLTTLILWSRPFPLLWQPQGFLLYRADKIQRFYDDLTSKLLYYFYLVSYFTFGFSLLLFHY